jgi:hypothetical protein
MGFVVVWNRNVQERDGVRVCSTPALYYYTDSYTFTIITGKGTKK